MGNKLLRHINLIGIGLYLLALVVISLAFRAHALQLKWMLWGIGEVLFFFVLTAVFYPRWKNDETKRFKWKVFLVALVIRGLYAYLISYYYYYETGMAFEYGAADSIWYHPTGVHLSRAIREGHVSYVFKFLNAHTMGWSDQCYTLWLTLIYTIFGRSLLTPRLFKALMSAYLCIVVYKLGSRTLGERTGRLAAVLCVFTPILIQSCGLHTKEMEMIFLSILALERMDYLIRSKEYTVWNILFPILLIGLTFGFRTIIGMCLIFAFLVFVVLSSPELVSNKAKIITISATVVVFFAFLFSPIGREMKIIYRLKFKDLSFQTNKYESMGLKHGELAQNWLMAPGAFVLPLAPMVEESPDHNKMIHGSTYVSNFIAFFAMLAIVIAFRQKKWRDFSLIGAYELSYLAIIAFSFAANSERFHEPAVPLIILMAAYAMTHLRRKELKIFYMYCGLLFVALFAWNWLKLSAREFDSIDDLFDKLSPTQTTCTNNLPDEYQEVEYIESNGTQWINTGIPINPKHTIYFDGYVQKDNMGQLIGGYYDQNNRLGTYLYGGSNNNKIGHFWLIGEHGQKYTEHLRRKTKIDVSKRFQSVQDKTGAIFIQGDSTYIVDSEIARSAIAMNIPDTTTYWTIFKLIKTIDSVYISMNGVLYEGKIWDENDELIAHYIPCYRVVDNEIGLYDLISKSFLTNAGNGVFLKGADVRNQRNSDSVVKSNMSKKNIFPK